jgi:hypothetical protein
MIDIRLTRDESWEVIPHVQGFIDEVNMHDERHDALEVSVMTQLSGK